MSGAVLALAIPAETGEGAAEFVRVEVWRSAVPGAPLVRRVECYAMPGHRISADPIEPELFMETIVANQRLRS